MDEHDIESEKRKVKTANFDKKVNTVTNLLQNCEVKDKFKLDGSTIVYDSDEEEVVEGHIFQQSDNQLGLNMPNDPPPPQIPYDAANTNDGEKAQDQARSIRIEFEPNDILFWFSQLEGEMLLASVGSQWLKKTILQRNLPNKQKEDVKSYLAQW